MRQVSAMCSVLETPTVVQQLRACASDPMWADHCEMSKATAKEAADLIDALLAELCHASSEASGCNAELIALAEWNDTASAVRDARLATQRLSALQERIRAFCVKAGA